LLEQRPLGRGKREAGMAARVVPPGRQTSRRRIAGYGTAAAPDLQRAGHARQRAADGGVAYLGSRLARAAGRPAPAPAPRAAIPPQARGVSRRARLLARLARPAPIVRRRCAHPGPRPRSAARTAPPPRPDAGARPARLLAFHRLAGELPVSPGPRPGRAPAQ